MRSLIPVALLALLLMACTTNRGYPPEVARNFVVICSAGRRSPAPELISESRNASLNARRRILNFAFVAIPPTGIGQTPNCLAESRPMHRSTGGGLCSACKWTIFRERDLEGLAAEIWDS